jgi:t-SNARE complex subunit (syntaxin)
VHQVEKKMRDISTLNQLLSAAVMSQAEQIETIYNNAVDATFHLQRGNESLKKAVKLNRSSQLYIFVLLMTASLLLLFFDWFYS